MFPTKRLKHVVALRRLRTPADDAARPYVGLEDIESGTGRLAIGATGAPGETPSPGTDFEPGDVLFGKLRPYLAKAWVAEFRLSSNRCG